MKNRHCICYGNDLVGKQTKYCSDNCLRKMAAARAKQKKADERAEQLQQFKLSESGSIKRQRAELMKQFRRGEKLTSSQLQNAWQTFEEYIEIRSTLLELKEAA